MASVAGAPHITGAMPSDVALRPPRPNETAAARALAAGAVAATPYAPAILDALAAALEGRGAEWEALVAARAGEVVGVAVYGLIAGAAGAGRLHLVAVTAGARLRGVGTALVDAAVAALAARGARFVLAELADDPRMAPGRELVLHAGFAEESRVPDFYADGIDLAFLRRDTGR